MKRIWLLISAVALVATACGGTGATTTTGAVATTTAAAGTEPVTGPAAIAASAQESDGTSVVVDLVTLPAGGGFIAIHADESGSPGAVLGHSDLLPEGESTNVTVTLDTALTASATVWPMAHIDGNGNGTYEFPGPDGPATLDGGGVAVVPAEITVG